MKNKKRRRTKKKKQQSLVIPFLVLIILIGGILLTSKTILNDIKTSISINKVQEITFKYTNKNNTIITVSNNKISDKEAINSSNKYKINITGNNDYQIKIINLSPNIDPKYIKLYLTDKNDNRVSEYTSYKTLSELENTSNGRVLYSGNSKKNNKLNLRVWIDKNYKGNSEFSYKLVIK